MTIAVDFDGTCVKHRYPMVGKVLADLYIDDSALGIPLFKPENDRAYVDWNGVRNLLIARNII